MKKVYSVGHGTRSLGEIVDLLRGVGIDLVADVRRYPASRRHPHTRRESLAQSLPESGIGYEWWGEALGGRRTPRPDSPNSGWRDPAFRGFADHMDSPEFTDALDRLVERASAHTVAFMCAETLWWRCHRRLIADALFVRGLEVRHILDADDARPHEPSPFLVVDGTRLLYPAAKSPLFS